MCQGRLEEHQQGEGRGLEPALHRGRHRRRKIFRILGPQACHRKSSGSAASCRFRLAQSYAYERSRADHLEWLRIEFHMFG